MAATASDFRARFPEFSSRSEYPDARVELFLADAVLLFMGSDEARWCGKYDVAQAYLAAHMLAASEATELGDASAKVGANISKTAGGVSVTKGSVAKDRSDGDDWLVSTAYGQRYMVIRNTCFVGVLAATL